MTATVALLFPPHEITEPHEVIELSDGARAERVGDAIDFKAADGAILLHYEAGKITIAPARGDLELVAPAGRIVMRAALDVTVEAGRDVSHKAGRKLRVDASEIEATSKATTLSSNDTTLLTRRLATTAENVLVSCSRYEVRATRLVQKAKEMFRDVDDLAQDRLGRVRTIVRDVYSLATRRSVMKSEEETSIDGSQILLG